MNEIFAWVYWMEFKYGIDNILEWYLSDPPFKPEALKAYRLLKEHRV